jgi:N-acetylmuramoyl-L-alanine amidase
MREFCLFAIMLVLSCLPVFRSNAAYALSLDEIRFGAHPEKKRVVLELSDYAEFRVFVLSNPYRLVIDLPEIEWNAGTVSRPPYAFVDNIRQGRLKPGVSRIVFDLEFPVIVRSAFFLPEAGAYPNRLVVDYERASTSAFAAEKGKLLGDLDINRPGASVKRASAAVPATAGSRVPRPAKKKPVVIIDPGHGGKDPGAVGRSNIYEKNVTLAAAKELRRQLLATGRYRVRMTRESDIYLKLYERVAIARKYNAALFVSIHADSIDNSSVRGASVYTLSKKASDAQTAKLAERENRADFIGMDLSEEDEDVAIILTDLLMNDTMNQSNFLANTLENSISHSGAKMLPNPHRSAGFAVLKAPDIPSVLIEIGFMSNAYEAKLLSSHSYRKKIVSSIRAGIENYFAKVRKDRRS